MKKTLLVIGIVFLVLCLFSGAMYIFSSGILSRTHMPVTDSKETLPDVTDIIADSQEPETQAEAYVSPIDFDKLQGDNPDICAWLDIPETNISYPVLLRIDDNAFYLNHDSAGNYSPAGALFIEDYNSTDFGDPLTIIYGHNMYTMSAEMFGSLQKLYSDGNWFAQNPNIYLYTPDRTIKYMVFAATPYSNRHILYYFDFSDKDQFGSFFDDVLSVRTLSANFNDDATPTFGENILILSTCMKDAEDQRYLVIAKEVK